MAGKFLSDEEQAKVEQAVASQEADESVEETPAGGASPAQNAADSAGAATPEEGDGAGKKTPEEQGDGKPKGPIPYERFREVNQAKAAAESKLKAFEENQAKLADELARARVTAYLSQMAEKDPYLAAKLRGENPETPEKEPEDPVQRELQSLKKGFTELSRSTEEMRRKAYIQDLERKAESEIDLHPALTKWMDADEGIRELIETDIAQRILAQPNTPVEKVVEFVAQRMRTFEERIKADLKQDKIQATKKIPAGVGGGGAAPPGQQQRKLSLDKPGDLSRAFAAELARQMQQE